MKKQLVTLATMVLVTLLAFSLSQAQVATFRMVETTPSPHPVGSTFTVQFRADAAVHGADQIRTLMLYVSFPNTIITPSNPVTPFSNINADFSFTTANSMVGDNMLLLTVLGNGPATVDDILLAEVEFSATDIGVGALSYDVTPSPDNGTRYSLTSDVQTPIIPTVQGLDVSTPVQLSAFTVVPADRGVTVKWRTESEINSLGFDIYRSEDLDGKFAKVNQARIKGAGTDATPHNYKFIDENIEVGKTYYYYIEDISYSGERNRSHIIRITIDATGKLKIGGVVPLKFALFQNFPNPFNPETWIAYQLPRDASVTVRIYNLKGQPIRTIELGKKVAGTYLTRDRAAYWDGRDNFGEKVASGVYFYTLQAGKFMATRRMVIIE